MPATNRPISSIGRCVAERPMRWNGALHEALEPLQREREVRAALRARDGVHLVEDHRLDPAERLARLRGQEQEERLGRRDEDVGRRPQHPAPLLRRRVAGPHRDLELRVEPRERAAKVPLDVVVERLERRDVEQPQPSPGDVVQPVDADEERRQRLSRARRGLDENVPALAIAGQPSACAGVGPSNARSNHRLVRGEKDVERVHATRVRERRQTRRTAHEPVEQRPLVLERKSAVRSVSSCSASGMTTISTPSPRACTPRLDALARPATTSLPRRRRRASAPRPARIPAEGRSPSPRSRAGSPPRPAGPAAGTDARTRARRAQQGGPPVARRSRSRPTPCTQSSKRPRSSSARETTASSYAASRAAAPSRGIICADGVTPVEATRTRNATRSDAVAASGAIQPPWL